MPCARAKTGDQREKVSLHQAPGQAAAKGFSSRMSSFGRHERALPMATKSALLDQAREVFQATSFAAAPAVRESAA